MNRIIIIIVLNIFNKVAINQDKGIHYLQLNRKEIRDLEISLDSEFVDSTVFTLPRNPLDEELGKMKTTALIYKRPTNEFPLNQTVWYLFEENSEKTSSVIFQWGLYNPKFNANKNRELLEDLNKKESEFYQLFEYLFSMIQKEFGNPNGHLSNIDEPHILSKNYVWDSKGQLIQLKMEFSRKIQEFPGLGLQTNNFEIRVITRNNAM